MFKKLILTIILVLMSSVAVAATYTCGAGGTYATVTAAMAAVDASGGDIFQLVASITDNITWGDNDVGTTGDQVILDLGGFTIDASGGAYGVLIDEDSYIKIRNGTISGGTTAGIGISANNGNANEIDLESDLTILNATRGVYIFDVKNDFYANDIQIDCTITTPGREGIIASVGDPDVGESGQLSNLTITSTITGAGSVTANEGEAIQIATLCGSASVLPCHNSGGAILQNIKIDGATITNPTSNAIILKNVTSGTNYVRNSTISGAIYGGGFSLNAVRIAGCIGVDFYGNTVTATESSGVGDGNALIIDGISFGTLDDTWDWTQGSKQVTSNGAAGNALVLYQGAKVTHNSGTTYWTVDYVVSNDEFWITSNFTPATQTTAVDYTSWSTTSDVYLNKFYANRDGNGSGVSIYLGKNNNIFFNEMYNNVRGVIVKNVQSTGNKIFNNTIYGNTDLGAHSGDGIVLTLSAPSVYIRNNIISNMDGYGISEDSTDPDSDYNDIYDCDDGAVNGFTIGTNSLTGDPLLVSATDFNLKPGSPAVDTGLDVDCASCTDLNGVVVTAADGSALFGTAPDIGAYESGTPYWSGLYGSGTPKRKGLFRMGPRMRCNECH